MDILTSVALVSALSLTPAPLTVETRGPDGLRAASAHMLLPPLRDDAAQSKPPAPRDSLKNVRL